MAPQTRTPDVAPSKKAPASGFDLLRLRPVRAMIRWPGFPYVFQTLFLVVFVGSAVLSWGYFSPEGIEKKDYAKTHFVMLLVWGLWWPAMIWVAVWFGRVWCAVCPLELVSSAAERLGRGLGISQTSLPRLAQSGALILALYAVVQMAVVVAQLHRVPAYTSIYLWSLLGVAAVTGLALKDRAFCRGFCPVGLLLGTYGRGSTLAVRSLSSQECDECEGKDRAQAASRARLDSRSCPSLLNPSRLNSSADCLLCCQCAKANPGSRMGLLVRRPYAVDDAREKLASWPVTGFVMLVSGFVAYELSSEWKAAEAAFLWVPQQVSQWLGAADYSRWMQAIWTLLAVPAILWTALGATVRVLGGARSLAEAWRRLALPLAVLMAAGQMAKGVAKFCSWVGYLPYAIERPTGTETALAIAGKTIPKPTAVLTMPVVSIIGVAVLAVMLCFALRESRLADPATHRARVPALLLVGLASLLVVFGWGFLAG